MGTVFTLDVIFYCNLQTLHTEKFQEVLQIIFSAGGLTRYYDMENGDVYSCQFEKYRGCVQIDEDKFFQFKKGGICDLQFWCLE